MSIVAEELQVEMSLGLASADNTRMLVVNEETECSWIARVPQGSADPRSTVDASGQDDEAHGGIRVGELEQGVGRASVMPRQLALVSS